MKTICTLMTVLALAASTELSAKELKIKITGTRSERGRILVMAHTDRTQEPVYGMAEAKEAPVIVTLTGLDGETAVVSVLHDEDGDYRMKTGERGPLEGYALSSAELPDETNTTEITLTYPAAE